MVLAMQDGTIMMDEISGETDEVKDCFPKSERKGWPYTPHVIIFFSSACIMVVEIVAGRLIARHLGSSLYTWTSIIGVVLAGMSIGNYLGGKMADRYSPERSLGLLFLGASVSCVLSLYLNNLVGELQQHWDMMFPFRVILSSLFIFILPALALGTISPVTAKMALDRSLRVGSTIGSVYAWGAIGSILGTFATGFFLIAALGSKGVVLLIAMGLGFIGLCLGPWRILQTVWVLLIGVFFWLSQSGSFISFQLACDYGLQEGQRKKVSEDGRSYWERYLFSRDGNYQFVKVYEEKTDDNRSFRTLVLDYLIHGYYDISDPKDIRYSYEKVYAEMARLFVGEKKGISAFFLGGGAYTFPRWVHANWSDATCDVAEIDPLVLEANHAAIDLDRDTKIRTYVMDARIVVDELPPGRLYDMIIGDAFTDLSIPYHLTTVEFQQKLANRLKPDGVLLQNVIDDFGKAGYFLGAYMLTLKQVFKHVYIFCTGRYDVSMQRDTFVLVAFNTDDPAIHEGIQKFHGGHGLELDASLLNEHHMSQLASRCKNRILTDDNAPVENLIEPVVRVRGKS
jgi:spermidine synthase